MKDRWVPHDLRDEIVDFIAVWSPKTELPIKTWLEWIGLSRSKFYDWKRLYGKANEHNGKVPRDFWLEPWEREAIVRFHSQHPLEGYRRLTFMMLDDDVVAVSPSSVYRVLREAGMTHVRTSPYYPQSNGKIERWQRTIKADALRRHQPSTVEDARKVIEESEEERRFLFAPVVSEVLRRIQK